VDLKRLHQIRDIIHRPIPEQEIQDSLSLSGEDTTGISPRISPSLHMAYKSFIKLNNEGNYRNKQKDNIIEAMKLQIAVWILNHTYELEHCYDVDYIEDPDRFVSVALHCVQKKSDLLTGFLPQLDELSEIPPDEINKQIITTLPTRFEDDIKSGSDDLVRKKRYEVEHYAADVLKEIHENGDTELLIENTSYNKEDFDQIIDNIG
jgi:hypothetical protein